MTRARATPDTICVHVPFRLVKRGGRKEMILPPSGSALTKIDGTLVKALARAFRWKRMLDSGEFTTIAELADSEGIAISYLTRVLRLTLLAPQAVETILDGRQTSDVTLAALLERFPDVWASQRFHRGGPTGDVPSA